MAGPQFIRPDPNLRDQNAASKRITDSIDKIGSFLDHVTNRRFEQARFEQQTEISAQQNELTRSRIALNKIKIDDEHDKQIAADKTTMLHTTLAKDLRDRRNEFINDPDSMTEEALQKYNSDSSRLFDSDDFSKEAENHAKWGTGQIALKDKQKFTKEIDDSTQMLTAGTAFMEKEDLDPRKKFATRRGPLDEKGKASTVFQQLDEWTPATKANALSRIRRAINEDAGEVQVIPGPDAAQPTADGTAQAAAGSTEEAIGKVKAPAIEPIGGAQPQGAIGINGLMQDHEIMEVIASDTNLMKLFNDAGGDSKMFTRFEAGGEAFFKDASGVSFGFDNEGNFLQLNQIPAANRAAAAPEKLLGGGTFKIGEGMQFDTLGFAHVTDTNGVTLKIAKTNIPGFARVVDTFSPKDSNDFSDILGGDDEIDALVNEIQPVTNLGVPPSSIAPPAPGSPGGTTKPAGTGARQINVTFSDGKPAFN